MLAETRPRMPSTDKRPMSDRTARILAWVAFALGCLLWAVDAVFSYLTRGLSVDTNWSTSSFAIGVAYGLMLLTFPIAGVLISTRRPRSRIGWLLTLTGFCWIMSGITAAADYGLR